MFTVTDTWQSFMIPVEIRNNDTAIELRGMNFVTGITSVSCDWMSLVPAGLITANILAADSVLSYNIVTKAITTKKLGLDRIIGDANEALLLIEPGMLWWRSDLNQLRFRSDLGIEKILKEPLYAAQGENQVQNYSFEVEGLVGLPYGWNAATELGSPTFARTNNQQYNGQFSAAISCGGTGHKGRFDSNLISVTPGKKYLASVRIKGSPGTTTYSMADLRWYDKYGVYLDPPLSYPTPFAGTVVTATWVKHSNNNIPITVPSNAYFCHISLLNIELNGVIYFDEVIFSEQRASVSAGGTVNDVIFTVPGNYTIPDSVFTNTQLIPSAYLINDADYTFVTFQVYNPSSATFWVFRIHDVTANTDSGRIIWAPINTSDSEVLMIAIPWNVKSHDLRIQVYQNSGSSKTIYVGPLSWYGFSPHIHA
jgi:hypothetical protein